MKIPKRIIIIGSGLAGVFLSARMCLAGHSVKLVDAGPENRASNVAAGLFNIVTGRSAVKTWMAETLLAELMGFFDHPDFQALKVHLQLAEIYRPFRSSFDANEWLGKSGEPWFRDIVIPDPTPRLPEQINNPDGGLRILPCGRADTLALLPGILQVLESKYGLERINEKLDYTTIEPEENTLELAGKSTSYDELVFCDGLGLLKNPFFNWLPLRPLKGQVLNVEIPDFDPGFILSRKIFLIPTPEGSFLAGSTYERQFEHSDPTPEGRKELEYAIKNALYLPFKVIEQRAGIRPTTPDRRPMMGTHPEYKHLHVLNGLGTKGWLQAPYLSKIMMNSIEGDKNSLSKVVNITRYLT